MVKSTIILLSVLAVVLAGSYFESKYVNAKFEYFEQNLNEVIEKTKNGEDGIDELLELIHWWNKEKHLLHAFIPHNDIKDFEGIMVESYYLLINGENIHAITKLRKLDNIIKAIPENYHFSFGNIF